MAILTASAPRSSSGTAYEAVCIGETMGQFVPSDATGIEHAGMFALGQAGAESNVAIVLARLGHSVAWSSRLGDDPVGRRVLAAIAREGVDTSLVRMEADQQTGIFLKDMVGGDRPVTYYRARSAASHLDRFDVLQASRRASRIVHTSGVTVALSDSCADGVTALLHGPRPAGVRYSFDVNYRARLWSDHETASTVLQATANSSNIAFVGLDEAMELWRVKSVDGVRAALPGPDVVVVKDGSRSAVAFVGSDRYEVPALSANIVDAVGAGDSFAGGFLHALLDRQPWRTALRAGHVAARTSLASVSDVGLALNATDLARDVLDENLW